MLTLFKDGITVVVAESDAQRFLDAGYEKVEPDKPEEDKNPEPAADEKPDKPESVKGKK